MPPPHNLNVFLECDYFFIISTATTLVRSTITISCLGYCSCPLIGLPASVFGSFYSSTANDVNFAKIFLKTFHFTQCKNQILTMVSIGRKSPFAFLTSLCPHLLWSVSGLCLPQDICTGYSLCLECFFSRYLQQISIPLFPSLCSNITLLTKP